MRYPCSVLMLCLALLALPLSARAGQDVRVINKAIDEFLSVQTRGLPGTTTYIIGGVGNSERLTPCKNLQVALPQGGRLWGKTTVVVRCEDSPGWALYVPVKIKVVGNYLVSSHALRQGQTMEAPDVAIQSGDLTELPIGTLTDTQQAVGRTLAMSIAAGRPLRNEFLRQVFLVQQGQTVKVVSKGEGFEVANDGEALNNAAQGQVVRVRLASGQLVNGVAESAGRVVVAY